MISAGVPMFCFLGHEDTDIPPFSGFYRKYLQLRNRSHVRNELHGGKQLSLTTGSVAEWSLPEATTAFSLGLDLTLGCSSFGEEGKSLGSRSSNVCGNTQVLIVRFAHVLKCQTRPRVNPHCAWVHGTSQNLKTRL